MQRYLKLTIQCHLHPQYNVISAHNARLSQATIQGFLKQQYKATATRISTHNAMLSLPTIQCYLYPQFNAISTHNAMASYVHAKVNYGTSRVAAEGCAYYNVIFTYDKLCTLNWVYI